MQKILVISDLHISRAGDRIIGLDPSARLQRVLDAAKTDHPDALYLILLGDLTHHGLPEEYERLATQLAGYPIPIIPLLGNHDRRAAFLTAFPDSTVSDSGHIQYVIDLPQHRLITLDTLDGPPYPAGHHSGKLCQARMQFLAGALKGAEGRMPIVFTHHPPVMSGIVGMDKIRLADGAAFLDVLAAHNPVHLISGHIHRVMSGTTRGVGWSMFKSPCHQGVINLTDANSSLSVDEPGSYGLLLLSEDGIVVHHQDVMEETASHVTGLASNS